MPDTLRPTPSLFIAACLVAGPACTGVDDPDLDAHRSLDTGPSGNHGAATSPELDPVYLNQCAQGSPLSPDDLDILPPEVAIEVFIQHLLVPTMLNENAALHLRLPAPADPQLEGSLVRVVGTQEAPLVLFSSDALVELGHLQESPGPDFFTAFARVDEQELLARSQAGAQILAGQTDPYSLVFEGREVVGRAVAEPFDHAAFDQGAMVALNTVTVTPVSTPQNWSESVLINDPAVVTDPSRTYDPCTETGDACGPWTFCHLMTEMANEPRTGISPEEFTLAWLEEWMSDTTINGDTIAARTAIQSKIIDPWLVASGGQELDLEKAPFRLLAIVNRLDLRTNEALARGYALAGLSTLVDAGELRFVFGALERDYTGEVCEPMPFTTIFEYDVPIEGCEAVRDWAKDWVVLDALGSFGSQYRTWLENLTERVVVRDAAPEAGNGGALAQLRTNEIALDDPWELREFKLADQDFDTCEGFTDLPRDGLLASHTVAATPDDGAHMPTSNALVDDFLREERPVPTNFDCAAAGTTPFLGANSHASLSLDASSSPQGSWLSSSADSEIRHEFSKDTCNGCHTCDTGTVFTHIDPMSPFGASAALSGFLTGITVADTQDSSIEYEFADLARRYADLYDVASAVCGFVTPVDPNMFSIQTAPVFDVVTMNRIYQQRAAYAMLQAEFLTMLTDFGGPLRPVSH